MEINESLVCPKCKSKNFTIKRVATYLYSYKFNAENVVQVSDETETLPFLFDNREKVTSREYIECGHCSAKYPISLDNRDKTIDLTILRKAIRADHVDTPEFLG